MQHSRLCLLLTLLFCCIKRGGVFCSLPLSLRGVPVCWCFYWLKESQMYECPLEAPSSTLSPQSVLSFCCWTEATVKLRCFLLVQPLQQTIWASWRHERFLNDFSLCVFFHSRHYSWILILTRLQRINLYSSSVNQNCDFIHTAMPQSYWDLLCYHTDSSVSQFKVYSFVILVFISVTWVVLLKCRPHIFRQKFNKPPSLPPSFHGCSSSLFFPPHFTFLISSPLSSSSVLFLLFWFLALGFILPPSFLSSFPLLILSVSLCFSFPVLFIVSSPFLISPLIISFPVSPLSDASSLFSFPYLTFFLLLFPCLSFA